MAFPSTISTFNQVAASDRLNNPSHSALHNSVSSVLVQVQTVIGTDASTLGTIIGDLRNPASGGGGHVQTANKGGTGQTAYTKGDILVASSSSVLTKLAAGNDGQIIKANSSVAVGIHWVDNSTPKIATSGSTMSLAVASITETSILSVTIPGSVLGTGNAVRARVFVGAMGTGTVSSVLLKANYGGGYVASVMLIGDGNGLAAGFKGVIDYTVLANNSRTSQMGILQTDIHKDLKVFTSPSLFGVVTYHSGAASVLSDGNQTIGLTVRFSDGDSSSGITINGYVVEKIT